MTRSAGGVKPLHQTNFNLNNIKSFVPKDSVKETRESDFKFPDGGWECSKCQNYNFKGRKECHRCKKSKAEDDCEGMPQHLTMSPTQRAEAKKKGLLKKVKTGDDVDTEESCEKKQCCGNKDAAPLAKKIQERVGDWACQRCFNHNFAFRDVCNMCYLSHIESNKMLYGQQSQRYESIQTINQYPQPQYQGMQMQAPMMQVAPSMSCTAPAWTPKFSNYWVLL